MMGGNIGQIHLLGSPTVLCYTMWIKYTDEQNANVGLATFSEECLKEEKTTPGGRQREGDSSHYLKVADEV